MKTAKDITHVNLPSLKDPSLWAVMIGNLVSIIMAFVMGWDMGQIMWIYWGQSVIIGILNVMRMMSLENFSTKGMTMNGSSVPETPAAKRQIAGFFAIHYGGFHLGYAVFLWQQMALNSLSQHDFFLLILCITGFFAAHRFSLGYNANTDFKQKKPNLGTLMFYPYMRIIPMHLTIIFGGMLSVFGDIAGSAFALILFMTLKTLADAGMHMVEHHIFRKPDKDAAGHMKD